MKSNSVPFLPLELLWRCSGLSRRKLRRLLEELGFSTKVGPKDAKSKRFWSELFYSSSQPQLAKLFLEKPSEAPFPYFSAWDLDFPSALHQLYDAPLVLYYQGRLSILKHPGVFLGVVGTRRASAYAREVTLRLVKEAKAFDPVIVSGMAAGLDSIAHEAALAEDLNSIGILGMPLDRSYGGSRSLFKSMREEGLLLSELYPGAALGPWRFPERNRLIAALSDVLIVVEAPEKSGALITAKEALELGKEIYVVPGPYYPRRNQGGHRLIQEGAHLLTSVEEIFENLGFIKRSSLLVSAQNSPLKFKNFDQEEQKILHILSRERASIDKMVELSQLAASQVSAIIMSLNLKGVVQELPGGLYGLCPQWVIAA
ncbi:MAG: DNA-processing protein DprA [Deltaproteobacteria bacterium]|nr:DNA-processing protein DprA [Deltaproteobacteria bacterium]